MKIDLDKKTWTITIKCKNEAEVLLFFEYFRLGTDAYVKKITKEAFGEPIETEEAKP